MVPISMVAACGETAEKRSNPMTFLEVVVRGVAARQVDAVAVVAAAVAPSAVGCDGVSSRREVVHARGMKA